MNNVSNVISESNVHGAPAVAARRGMQFMVLVIAAAVAALAQRSLSPLQDAIRHALSLTDNEIALLQGPALAVPVVLGAIPLGFVVDRYSRVKLLLGFVAFDALGSAFTGFSSSFITLLLARCLVGFTTAAITVTVFSLLADLYPPAQRGRAKAMIGVGQYVGTSIAFALGGLLLATFDHPNDWHWASFWLTVPLFLLVALLITLLREPIRTNVVVRSPSSRDSFIELWRYRGVVVPLIAGIVFAELGLFAVLTWASPALARRFDLAPERVGAIMATTLMVSGLLGPILGGTLADLCQRTGGPRRTAGVLSILGLLGASVGFFALAPGITVASCMLVAFTAIVGATISMGTTVFTIVVPNELRGLCFAILAACAALIGIGLAPVIVSLLAGVIGGTSMIGTALAIVCTTGSLACASMFALGRKCTPHVV